MAYGASPHWTLFAQLGNRDPMSDKTNKPAKDAPKTREERLKAALKANMGKRKAQARARKATETDQKE